MAKPPPGLKGGGERGWKGGRERREREGGGAGRERRREALKEHMELGRLRWKRITESKNLLPSEVVKKLPIVREGLKERRIEGSA